MVDRKAVEAAVLTFFSSPDQPAPIDFLRSQLPDAAVLYIVGGSIRNLIMGLVFGNAPRTADIDIFIGSASDDYVITGLLEGEVFEETDFTPNNSSPIESCSSGVKQDLNCLKRSFPI